MAEKARVLVTIEGGSPTISTVGDVEVVVIDLDAAKVGEDAVRENAGSPLTAEFVAAFPDEQLEQYF